MSTPKWNPAERFLEKVEKVPGGCWEWRGSKSPNGYGFFWDGRKTVFAHRFSHQMHNGTIPRDLMVMHSCDNPGCVNPEHLTVGTHTDNMEDRGRKGRAACGTRHGRSKLSEEQVLAIRGDSRTLRCIAADYGVHRTIIHRVKRREIWAHV